MGEEKTEIRAYIECMKQIHHRVGLVIKFIDNGETLGNDFFDFELVSLNFRKILELIAYSSLSANRTLYQQAYGNVSKAGWNADGLLKEMEKINQDFYPKPTTHPENYGDKEHGIVLIKNGYLTREEFKKLYSLCGDVLHVKNVFKAEQNIDFSKTLKEWLKQICVLLDCHIVSFPSKKAWLVQMKGVDGEPVVYELTQTNL